MEVCELLHLLLPTQPKKMRMSRRNGQLARYMQKKSKLGGGVFFIFLGVAGVPPPIEQPKTTTGPVGIFPEVQNPIGLVVNKILSFYRRTDIILLCFITSGFAPSLQGLSPKRYNYIFYYLPSQKNANRSQIFGNKSRIRKIRKKNCIQVYTLKSTRS